VKTFFVPGHISGFFEVKYHPEPLKTGSRGVGIVLEDGVNTGVIINDSDGTQIKIFFEGVECRCRTTLSVVKSMLKDTCGAYNVEVHHFPKLPLAYGFGISGSGALGTALALNHALELDMDYNKLGQIAHIAEVRNNTGLGDVVSELSRGLVIRSKEGAPGNAKIKSFPIEGYVVSFIIGKPLLTKTVLSNVTKQHTINVVGKRCIQTFLKNSTSKSFLEQSKKFTLETGIAQSEVLRSIKNLEKAGVDAGMCMLGNSVFTLTDDPEKVVDLLKFPTVISKPLKKDIRDH
jgi:pantoate kinase